MDEPARRALGTYTSRLEYIHKKRKRLWSAALATSIIVISVAIGGLATPLETGAAEAGQSSVSPSAGGRQSGRGGSDGQGGTLPSSPGAAVSGPGLDVGAVIEKVGHAVTTGASGLLEVEDRLYLAQFQPEGFTLSLREPQTGISVPEMNLDPPISLR